MTLTSLRALRRVNRIVTITRSSTRSISTIAAKPRSVVSSVTRQPAANTRLSALATQLAPPTTQRRQSYASMCSPPAADAPAAPGGGEAFFRLPTDLKPTHYDLTILSDLEALRFQGAVTIHFDVKKSTDTIVLNAASILNVGKAIVGSEALKTESRSVVELSVDKAHERVTAKVGAKLPEGSKASITIAFEAEIDDSMTGFYRSTWEHDGKKGFCALTQFEPTSARRAFPCFDEPEAKATYNFKMIHRSDTVPLANMPVSDARDVTRAEADKLLHLKELGITPGKTEAAAGKTEAGGAANDKWTITEFEKLPLVSSYLVAWANGPFVKIEGSFESTSGKTVKTAVYATPEHIHQCQLALDVTNRAVPIYEKLFDIPFPLPKSDLLVASDFSAGAMENWGLITGRTAIYLYDPERSGLAGMKRTVSVQSHELAHQWFGNIVTPKWWDNLWLNEAWATLAGESIILDRLYPEWESNSEFISVHLERAFELDGKRSSHPIELPLKGDNVEDAINQIFDACSYSKGGSVLRMLSSIVGEDVFLKGTSIYLKKHLYGSAETADLWAGIAEASGLDVPRIMNDWIKKIGFPVITVTEAADGKSIKLRQDRFLSSGDVKPEENETLWYVPLAIVGPDGKIDHSAVLDQEREKSFNVDTNATFKLNAGTSGVFRVSYSPERLEKLGLEASKVDGVLKREDRVGLISDAFTLAKAGNGKTSGALSLQLAIGPIEEYLTQSMASANLGALASVWYEQPDAVRKGINAVRAEIYGPLAKSLTFEFSESDSPDRKQLRAVVIAAAAAGEDEWTLSEIKRRFEASVFAGDDSAIHPDLLRTVYTNAAKHGGEKEYEAILAIFNKPPTPTHKLAAHLALCSSPDAKLLQRTFDWTLSDVKAQDYMYTWAGLSANAHGRHLVWENTKKHFDVVAKRLENSFGMGNVVKYAISSLTTSKDADDVEAFFKGKSTSKFDMALAQALESVRGNAAWLERDSKDVADWLGEKGYLKQ